VSEIVLRGSLEVLREQALVISEIVKNRSFEGFAVFQADEIWLYETELDDRVCPVCEAFGTQQIFRGDAIPIVFPDYDYFPSAEPFVVYPRVHQRDLSKFFYAPCRCRLIWQNPLECLERRLHDEKLRGLGS